MTTYTVTFENAAGVMGKLDEVLNNIHGMTSEDEIIRITVRGTVDISDDVRVHTTDVHKNVNFRVPRNIKAGNVTLVLAYRITAHNLKDIKTYAKTMVRKLEAAGITISKVKTEKSINSTSDQAAALETVAVYVRTLTTDKNIDAGGAEVWDVNYTEEGKKRMKVAEQVVDYIRQEVVKRENPQYIAKTIPYGVLRDENRGVVAGGSNAQRRRVEPTFDTLLIRVQGIPAPGKEGRQPVIDFYKELVGRTEINNILHSVANVQDFKVEFNIGATTIYQRCVPHVGERNKLLKNLVHNGQDESGIWDISYRRRAAIDIVRKKKE